MQAGLQVGSHEEWADHGDPGCQQQGQLHLRAHPRLRLCAGASLGLAAACGPAIQGRGWAGVPVRCRQRPWHLPEQEADCSQDTRPSQVCSFAITMQTEWV